VAAVLTGKVERRAELFFGLGELSQVDQRGSES
jgi:hypothetical protein